jgi:3-dehydroquinate synthase
MNNFTVNNKRLEADGEFKKEFSINSFPNSYKVKFEKFPNYFDSNDVILVDKNIEKLYNIKHEKVIAIEANEENKSVLTSLDISEKLLHFGFNKANKLVVIGGGITQDLGAYTAKTFKRGVDWVLYPTTLLSQCDSSIGGKTALNFNKFKNQIGLFSAPSEVIIDTDFLSTLSTQDIVSGYGEIIKLFLIGGDVYLNMLKTKTLNELIFHSLSIKKAVIEYDEFENSERKCLNLGHSFGHVIETLTNYSIPHGESVLLGMYIINELFDNNDDIKKIINKFTNIDKIKNIDTNLLIQGLKTDKKTYGNDITFIRVPKPGTTIFTNTKIDDILLRKINDIFAN